MSVGCVVHSLISTQGSGKTGSLVKALEFIQRTLSVKLRARGQRVS